MKQSITEEMGVHKAWFAEAREMTVAGLPGFIDKLTQGYNHDYGTICHAMAAAGLAAMWAINGSDEGGITGFQAGCVQWEIIRHWDAGLNGADAPLRLLNMERMLFPQHEDMFRTISGETWAHLQAKAREYLAGDSGVEVVRNHWQSVADGKVPFGFEVRHDD